MRQLISEYILKGLFLGLLLFVALQDPTWQATGWVALLTLGGLFIALGIAAGSRIRAGYQVKGKLAPFLLFLLLESPNLIYAGILLGMAGGAIIVHQPDSDNQFLAALGGGVLLGVLFFLLRQTGNRWVRIGLSLTLAAGLVAGALYWLHEQPHLLADPAARTMFGIRLLLGIPLFYLLTFAGIAEESEVEIGAVCVPLGLAIWTLTPASSTAQSFGLLVPALLYIVYTMRILPGLRVFKHVIRGMSYAKVGRYLQALMAFRRALQLDPNNTLARESLWRMHRQMDPAQVLKDPQLLALMDFEMCLDRARSLLMLPGPTPDRLTEAHRLLDLVLNQRPAVRPVVSYWRAVAHTHAKRFDDAAQELAYVLDSSGYPPDDPARKGVLFQAWQLALTLHPELNRRSGAPQLAIPGRRMEAIAAVERQLAANPDDQTAWEMKRLLYGGLTESEYKTIAAADRPAVDFDHGYVQQLGMALINDPARWQRGVEFLRLAARGLLPQAPSIFLQIAQAHEREGQRDAVWQYYEMAKRVGQAAGPKNLAEEDRQAYFTAVKLLAENARAREDYPAAIENYHLYAEAERSGLETLRILTELYERKGDVGSALRVTEQALLYDPKDKDLLERKDRYYYSLTPEELRARMDTLRPAFDVDYCLRKAKSVLDYKDADPGLLDWGRHLAELAQVIQPENLSARVLRARALRRQGEIETATSLLEEVYNNKPEHFATNADEDAWFVSCRLLGESYLYELGRPDLAVPCFTAFRKSSKSGADTLYKLGQAYEQLGDRARAAKCYEHVTSYDRHPLAPDARDALERLQSS
jgi:tetratricopeptide (TPR) repeat protein